MASSDPDLRPRTATDMHHPLLQAQVIVLDRANNYLSAADQIEMDDVYPVWFCYTLGGWKALISTTVADDRYYEVTHKAAGETFLDVYVKEANETINVDHPVHNL